MLVRFRPGAPNRFPLTFVCVRKCLKNQNKSTIAHPNASFHVRFRALEANKGEKIIKLSDDGGLQLWIMPIGSKLWHLAYRDLQGKQKKLAFGAYPTVGLADARKKRDEAKALLALGIDPGQQRKLEKITKAISDAATFDAVAEEYLAKKMREGMAASTVKNLRSQLRLVSPVFGNRPIAEITVPEVLAPLKKIDARGTHETASRTKELCGAIFRFGIATGRRMDDPTQAPKLVA